MKKILRVSKKYIDFQHCTEEEIIEKIHTGNTNAKEYLYQSYEDYIRTLIVKSLLTHHVPAMQVNDIAHELYFAFEDAINTYHKQCEMEIKQSATFKTYLTSVILHRLSDIHSKLYSFSSHHCLMDFQELYSKIEDDGEEERNYDENDLLNDVLKYVSKEAPSLLQNIEPKPQTNSEQRTANSEQRTANSEQFLITIKLKKKNCQKNLIHSSLIFLMKFLLLISCDLLRMKNTWYTAGCKVMVIKELRKR